MNARYNLLWRRINDLPKCAPQTGKGVVRLSQPPGRELQKEMAAIEAWCRRQ